MKATDTALLGHVSSQALSAASLSDLWTMCTGVFVHGRILGILCSQAVGAGNPKLAGIYLQISYFVLGIISVFVIIAWNFTIIILNMFGPLDDDTSTIVSDAGYYASVLSISIPGQVAISQLSQYFSSQKIMKPEVLSSIVALVANLVFGYIFVLGIPNFFTEETDKPIFDGFGFKACPIITTWVVYVQLFCMWFVFCYISKLHLACWGGWDWNEITRERIKTYNQLYIPAALSLASDFWRMAVIGALSAELGVNQVAVFNASYRIIWMTLIFVTSISTAAGINIGIRLGKFEPDGAQQAAYVGIGVCFIFLLIISYLASSRIRWIGSIFTNDTVLLDMLDDCRYPFVATLFFMNLASAIERVPLSMGRTKTVFWSGFVASWFGTFFFFYTFFFFTSFNTLYIYWTIHPSTIIFLFIVSIIT